MRRATATAAPASALQKHRRRRPPRRREHQRQQPAAPKAADRAPAAARDHWQRRRLNGIRIERVLCCSLFLKMCARSHTQAAAAVDALRGAAPATRLLPRRRRPLACCLAAAGSAAANSQPATSTTLAGAASQARVRLCSFNRPFWPPPRCWKQLLQQAGSPECARAPARQTAGV